MQRSRLIGRWSLERTMSGYAMFEAVFQAEIDAELATTKSAQ